MDGNHDGEWGEGPGASTLAMWLLLGALVVGPVIGLMNGYGMMVFAPHATFAAIGAVVWFVDRCTK